MQIHIRDAPPGKKTAQEPHGEHRPQPYVDVKGTRVSRMRAHSLIMHLERPAELARPAQLPPQHRQTTLRPAAAGLPRAAPLLPSGPLRLWRRGFRRAARAAAQEAAELCGEAFGPGAVGRESRLQRLRRGEDGMGCGEGRHEEGGGALCKVCGKRRVGGEGGRGRGRGRRPPAARGGTRRAATGRAPPPSSTAAAATRAPPKGVGVASPTGEVASGRTSPRHGSRPASEYSRLRSDFHALRSAKRPKEAPCAAATATATARPASGRSSKRSGEPSCW